MKTLYFFLFSFFTLTVTAQHLPVPSYWQGELPSEKKFIIAFHIFTDSTGAYRATMDSPGEGVLDIKCSDCSLRGDSIFISMSGLKAVFEGRRNTGDSIITGRWKQGPAIVPLTLKKKIFPVVYSAVKNQTPVPPFPYKSMDVEYDNAGKTVHFGATITYPANDNKAYPSIILITGSGQQDRDETILGHHPFAVIADYLTRQGYLVMRVDDRGVGKTKGDLKNATSADFAKDVEASLDFLLQQKQVDKKHIGLIGHSEGGMIAPMVAVNRKEISFLILLAAPGYAIADLMADQNEAILKQSGYSDESAASYRNFYKKLVTAIVNAPTDSMAIERGVNIFKEWQQTENESIITSLTGVPLTNTPAKFVKPFVAQLSSPWWKFFLNYDPQPTLKKLDIPVYAINGKKDVQVLPKSVDSINMAWKESASKKFSLYRVEGLNHLFQECFYCVVAEYGKLQESFSVKVLDSMNKWLKEVVK